jgi:hypothetical protein
MLNLISIPHTGTHFLKKILENAGFKLNIKHIEGWKPMDELIVSPLRDPYETYVSWVSRERDQDFTEKWHMFNDMYEAQNVEVVPIDTDNKRDHLKRLGDKLDTILTTDWKPVNSSGKKVKVDWVDLKEIYDLPVVKQFYAYPKPSEDDIKKVVRKLLAEQRGSKEFAPNLFADCVEQLMEQYQ